MRIIIPSRGRHDYSPTIEHMPEDLKKHVQVWVPKTEFKNYRRSPLFKGVEIECWPDYVDCIPKKRRFLYERIDGAYMALDDDLKLMVWDTAKRNFIAATENPDKFMRGIEKTWLALRRHTNVGIANTFMTSMKVNDKKVFEFNDVPFCFAGFSENRPKLQFKTFFFTDIAMPMQIIKKGESVITTAYCAYSMRANKKLATTGTTPYRSDMAILYSAISLAQQMPGHVTGLKQTGNLGGGWSLQKSFHRQNLEKSKQFLRDFAITHKLKALPPLVDLELKTPMAELYDWYQTNWNAAKKGKGNPIP